MKAASAFDVLASKTKKMLRKHIIECDDEDTEASCKKQRVAKG